MTFEFSRISKTSLTSVKYLKRHFLNHHACFFRNRPLIHRWIFLSRCWDIYPAHCTGLELFLELPQNKICYILHPKYTSFSCFPIIWASAILQSLFWRNKSYLRHFWCLEGSWLNVIPSPLRENSATCRLFSCIFYGSISTDVSKKVYVILCNLCTENVASSRVIICKSVLPCVSYVLINKT